MSFYVKLFLIIIMGTVASFVAINTLVRSTDHMPDTFNTTTTSYMDRKDNKAAEKRAAQRQLAAVREKSDTQIEIEKERGADAKAAAQRLEQQMVKEENALRESHTADKDDLQPLPPLPIATLKDDSEDEPFATNDQSIGSQSQPTVSGATGEPTRSDSDADIKAQTVSDITGNKAIKPNDIKTRTTSRNTNEILNIKKRAETVQALDLAYAPPAQSTCTFPENDVVRVGVSYRKSSYAIKGQSLTNIDQLIKLYNKCGGGKMLVLENAAGTEDTEERLIQLRKDEVKYYLLQRRVPKDDMIFSDNS